MPVSGYFEKFSDAVHVPNTTYATPSPDAERTTLPVLSEMAMPQAKPTSTFSTPHDYNFMWPIFWQSALPVPGG